MSVYVDNARIPYRGRGGRMMLMSHMIADTSAELTAMAQRIGVDREYLQDEGTYREHFDICLSKRRKAVALGAKEITQRQLGEMLRARRLITCPPSVDPTPADRA